MMFRIAALLAAMLMPLAGVVAAPSDRAKAAKAKAVWRPPPMIFYLAKGEEGACGPHSSEWIAAEGRIETDTAQKLRVFLNRLGKRRPPIFFHSPGGNGLASTAMGRLLRERDMTAGVYETAPTGCVGASEQACAALKRSGQVLPSTLRNLAACNSGCVYALIGAKVRQVPPGARLGVHSAKLIVPWAQARKIGFSDSQIASFERVQLKEHNGQIRHYVQEMKIDVRLFDLAMKVPHESVRYLSRAEIISFGIDTRQSHEAPWITAELQQRQLWAMKYFIAAKGQDDKELHTSVIRLECGDVARTKVSFYRGAGAAETGQRTIRLAAGSQSAALTRYGSAFKMDWAEADTSYSQWYVYVRYDFFEAAAAHGVVEIVESGSAGTPPRTIRLSTVGLAQAIAALRQRCTGA